MQIVAMGAKVVHVDRHTWRI